MFGHLLTTQMTTNKMILVLADFPHISLSNGENRMSLAASVLEIFKNHRDALYSGADNSSDQQLSFVPVFSFNKRRQIE